MIAGDARATIFALSSGPPPAAIAIVRVSGPGAGAALVGLAGRLPAARRATVATLRDSAGDPIDRALLLWLPGPATATGEDLAELHLHGGKAVVVAMLAALAALPGCRLAEPGEFTRRAFDNGRIDLLEAEGLADLLAAETEGERRRALRLAEGGLSRRIEGWRGTLLGLAARVEAQIEFGDDGDDVPPDATLAGDIVALAEDITGILAAPPAERLRDGVRVVLCGPPNSGKSTLLNALAGRPVAIASPQPGTTRDLIEAPVVIDGIGMILIDSAGLRDAADPIEREGVERAGAALAAADLLLWLGAPHDCPDRARSLLVRTAAPATVACDFDEPVDASLCSVTGEGLGELRQMLVARAASLLPPAASEPTTLQQRESLLRCRAALDDAAVQHDSLLAAEDLRAACLALDRLTGRAGVEDMLDALFGRFCLGK